MKFFTFVFLFSLGSFAHCGIFDSFPFIGTIEKRIENAIGAIAEKTLNELNSGVLGNITRSLAEVERCFEPQIGNVTLNLFDGSLKVMDIVKAYYAEYSGKAMSTERVNSLLASVRSIIDRCIKTPLSTAKFGLTPYSDLSVEEFRSQLLGTVPPTETLKDGRSARSSGSAAQCALRTGSSLPSRVDWRDTKKVSSVKNQGQCGSCWSFAAIASLESANLIRSGQSADLSEQRLVNCAKKFAGNSGPGGCSSGTSEIAFNYLLNRGTASEAVQPYTGSEGTCSEGSVSQRISDFCIRSKYYYKSGSSQETLTDDTIMRAVAQKGPLSAVINATPLQNYRGGVLNEASCSQTINHAVLLIGYDSASNSFIYKNSWGTWWGEGSGFFRVVRGKNMCGINTEVSWPIL